MCNMATLKCILGRIMARAVSRHTAEAWIHAWVSSCGICGGLSGTGMGFCPSSSVFPYLYHSTMAVHTV
jgi:hypothetical protein